jgi:hypothetical protein
VIKVSKNRINFYLICKTFINFINLPFPLNLINKSQRDLKKLQEIYGGQKGNLKTLVKEKKSDTLFILACGSSINEITDLEFAQIKNHDQIAIGSWLYHEFVPKMLLVEISTFPKLGPIHQSYTLDKLKSHTERYAGTRFLFKSRVPSEETSHHLYLEITKKFKFSWMDSRIIFSKSKITFDIIVFIFNSLGLFLDKDRFIQHNGSLIWSILMGYKLGYKKIVLCGVDLVGNYFFDDDKPNEDKHPTLLKSENFLSILEVVSIVQRKILIKRGIELYKLQSGKAFNGVLKDYEFRV